MSMTGTLADWQPEPLVPDVPESIQHVVTSKPGKYITIDGVKCLNLATHNYLGLAENQSLEDAAIEATCKYGVGSCGPRAFYGTMDIHLKLEEELAKFLGVQETVLYSFGFSTIASAIPAYIKNNDLVFIDEHCNYSIQQGLKAARCRTIKFKHNDCEDLEQKILAIDGNSKKTKLFLIVEGIYARTGKLCPLKAIIDIKRKYKIRLFIDESCSFGVLGSTGKGITEHYGCDIIDVDMTMVSLENAMCSFGGFCAGSTFLMDHQRLAGSGYCFSASLPPFQAQVALESLNIIRKNPSMIESARKIFAYANEKFSTFTKLTNISDDFSPIKTLVIRNSIHNSPQEDEEVLGNICESILRKEHIAISLTRYLDDDESKLPSIRVFVNAYLTEDDVNKVAAVLEEYSKVI